MIDNKKDLRTYLDNFHQGHTEFHQSVLTWYDDIKEYYHANKECSEENILERMIEPDRVLRFRVSWRDDSGRVRVNRGWRVQHSNCMGPYKGGLRFHPTVNESILKFLAFEQTFKNALTGLPMGGGKGGVDISLKQLSIGERERVCHAFMNELYRHIGEETDIPAGDIGVSAKEIGFLYGQYVKLTNKVTGSLTGKGLSFGGSSGRQEATGYGCIYFLECMLAAHDMELAGKTIAISGAGNVAFFTAEKALQKGAKVVTLSDSDGLLHCKDGIDESLLENIRTVKVERHGSLSEIKSKRVEFHKNKNPWHIPCDIAIPCATQNELDESAAKQLVKNKVSIIVEGANMPLTSKAEQVFKKANIMVAPSKAANAGGVAVSGFERTQNAQHTSWPIEKVDERLQGIMEEIHTACTEDINKYRGVYNYSKGANLAAFKINAKAIIALGAK